MPEHDTPDARRRGLLTAAALAAPAAALGVAATPEAEAKDAPEGAGLRDTEHTRAFYASARF